MLNKDKLLKALELDPGIVVDPDDPIFYAAYIASEAARQSEQRISELLGEVANMQEQINAKYLEDAKTLAEDVIGQAVLFAEERIESAADSVVERLQLMSPTDETESSSQLRLLRAKLQRARIAFCAMGLALTLLGLWCITKF